MSRHSNTLKKQLEYNEELEYRQLYVVKQDKKRLKKQTFISTTLGVIMIATLAFKFVSIETDILASQKRVESLTKEVYILKRENEVLEADIRHYITLDKVKEKALALGMEYPTEKNTIYYTKSDREYVRQNEALPTNKKGK